MLVGRREYVAVAELPTGRNDAVITELLCCRSSGTEKSALIQLLLFCVTQGGGRDEGCGRRGGIMYRGRQQSEERRKDEFDGRRGKGTKRGQQREGRGEERKQGEKTRNKKRRKVEIRRGNNEVS